ncbi:MAG: hypothetical protein KIS72_01170 [Luteimonas sp.]|nr:hypothetical protein [Luteimonas sp.]
MRLHALLLATVSCAACGDPPAAQATTETGAPAPAASAQAVDRLPLDLGYFVSADTPCAQASNATVTLHHGKGINSARTACEFTRIVKTGDDTYAVHDACTELMSGSLEESDMRITLSGPTAYAVRYEGGDEDFPFRHCPQPELPEPWRDNDLSDLLPPG